jgi:hypothetical protein
MDSGAADTDSQGTPISGQRQQGRAHRTTDSGAAHTGHLPHWTADKRGGHTGQETEGRTADTRGGHTGQQTAGGHSRAQRAQRTAGQGTPARAHRAGADRRAGHAGQGTPDSGQQGTEEEGTPDSG